MIDIRRIKNIVHSTMPGSSLDKILEKEPDSISEVEFAMKADIWDLLSREAQ